MTKSIAQTKAVQLSLDLWKCEDGEIRMTPDGQPSVFDMIRVLGGRKNPSQVWKDILRSYPEALQKTDDFKFKGRGQQMTPVAKIKEDAYFILSLLPGTVGRKYRENSAKLFVAYLDNPAGLAESLVERLTEEESKRLEARLSGKRTRDTFTNVLHDHGVEKHGYARCTNAVYVPILNANAQQLKAEIANKTNLPFKSIKPRDHMTIQQLTDVETAEKVATGQLRRTSAFGNKEVEKVVRVSAEFTRKLLDGEIEIPGIV